MNYPIMYDWIIAIAMSVFLYVYLLAYGVKHPGRINFIIEELAMLIIVLAWQKIFQSKLDSLPQPINTLPQVLSLAPVVAGCAGTFGIVQTNFSKEREQ